MAEVLLWQQIKGKKLKGFQFTRQKPISSYIVDFYCPKIKLAIEIDGSSHDNKYEKDVIRQRALERIGIKFLRFSEFDVRKNLVEVVNAISDWIDENS